MSTEKALPKDEQKVLAFLKELRAQWPKRFSAKDRDAEKAWVRLMVRDLKRYDEGVLAEAAQILLRRKIRHFPILGECHDACAQAQRLIAARSQPRLPEGRDSRGDRKGNHESLAYSLIRNPEGVQAAREGWIWNLFEYIRKEGVMPDISAQQALKAAARDTEQLYADLCAGRTGLPGARPALIEMCRKTFAKREELARMILGEDAA